jgi:hypothetical protein
MFGFLIRLVTLPVILAVYLIAGVILIFLAAFLYLFVGQSYVHLAFPAIK